jgi:heterodisulfide reductase subunit B
MEAGVKEEKGDVKGSDGSVTKCLLCLDPAEDITLAHSPDLIASFVTATTQNSNLASLSEELIREGMAAGMYCNRCYNQLHELTHLQTKIKTLKEYLTKLETAIGTEVLRTYSSLESYGVAQVEPDKVTELRNKLHKGKATIRYWHLLFV